MLTKFVTKYDVSQYVKEISRFLCVIGVFRVNFLTNNPGVILKDLKEQ